MKRTLALTVCLGLCYAAMWAASVTPASGIPAYYAAVDGKFGKSLFDQVHTIAKVGYHSLGYDSLFTAYPKTDVREDGTVWDMYSNCEFSLTKDKCGNYGKECDCYNREHSIPKSWFGGGTANPGCDIFHLVPTDGKVNGMRSNYPFGEVSSATFTSQNGSKLGSSKSITIAGKTIVDNSGFTATCSDRVFEPIDEYKGDFARAYFGTMIKWAEDHKAFTDGNGLSTFSGNYTASGNFGLSRYGVALLLKWHRQDPVSQKEIDRNNGIQATQGNRNPFIDYPYLAEYIWGMHAGEVVDMDQLINSQDDRFVPGESDGSYTITDPVLTASTSELSFAGITQGETSTLTFTLRGARLTGSITITLTGTDAGVFSVSPTTIAAANANGLNTLTVTYHPTQNGSHQAALSITTDGVEAQKVLLYGSCNQACTVTWLVDGSAYTLGDPTTSVATGTRALVLPTAPESCSDESETFVGWSEQPITTSQDETPADLFSDAEDAPLVNHDVTYYAVFAHLSQTGSTTPETLTVSYGSTAQDWIIKTSSHNDYWVLNENAYIESPEVELGGLKSITITMRTYGGAAYKTVDITCAGQALGSLSASTNKMADYTWKPSATLSGTGTLRFSSTTTTADNGPGIETITVISEGLKYSYSHFITTCTDTPTENIIVTEPARTAVKVIRNGQLLIYYAGQYYNAYGQIVTAE